MKYGLLIMLAFSVIIAELISVSKKLDKNCIDEKESGHKNMLLRWTAWLFLLIFGIPITICLILKFVL
jgi:preprotein translocase subunit SecG